MSALFYIAEAAKGICQHSLTAASRASRCGMNPFLLDCSANYLYLLTSAAVSDGVKIKNFYCMEVIMDYRKTDDYEEFAQILLEIVNEELNRGVKVSLNSVTKNNGVILTGMTFSQDGINASPTIYLEQYYDEYLRGKSIDSIAADLISAYSHNKLDESIDVDFFSDYKRVKEKLFCKVINRKLNEEMLKDLPYEEFMDLAIVPYCRLEKFGCGQASILVKNAHLKMWNISAEKILEDAKENTYNNMDFSLTEISKLILDMADLEEGCEMFDNMNFPMYVVCNKERNNGAVAMIFPALLERFAKSLKDDYCIIPSSVHELIIIPLEAAGECDGYGEMIRSVNENELSREEILSDHAYCYKISEGLLSIP